MIDRMGFSCETCGKTKVMERKDFEAGVLIPEGWRRDEHPEPGYALDFCSEKCYESYKRTHLCFSSPPIAKARSTKVIPVTSQHLGGELLRSLFEDSAKAREEAIEQMAKDFGVPAELVAEFGYHLQATSCPKCQAGAGELCKIQEDDETLTCPFHGTEELKEVAHKERIHAAKRSWKHKQQLVQ
jgi:hypothetical protein